MMFIARRIKALIGIAALIGAAGYAIAYALLPMPQAPRLCWATLGTIPALWWLMVSADNLAKGTLPPPAPPVEHAPRLYESSLTSRLAFWHTSHDAKVQRLPVSPHKMYQYFHGLYDTRNTSYARWAGTGKLFTRVEYSRLHLAMVEAGYIRWRDPNNHMAGSELTGEGRVMLHTYVLTCPGEQNIDSYDMGWTSIHAA